MVESIKNGAVGETKPATFISLLFYYIVILQTGVFGSGFERSKHTNGSEDLALSSIIRSQVYTLPLQ